MNTSLNTSSFKMLNQNELFEVCGGDTARQKMVAKNRANGGMKVSAADKKLVTSYTLGYLSAATCWCAPVSLALGIASTLSGCM